MELKRLQYFVTAAHELSFSGAARKLGVSQPVLSRGIKELEAYVGAELFNRSTTEISLTEAGESFLPNADEALLTLDQAILSLRQVVKGRDTMLDISYLPVLLDPFVGPAMETFRQAFENVTLRLHETQNQAQSGGLQDGKMDISFLCYYEGDDFGSEYDVFDIGEVDNCIVVSSSHPLAKAESASLQDVKDLDFIAFPSSPFPYCARATENYFKEQNMPFEPVMEANSAHSMIGSVIAGGSCAIMSFLGTTIASKSVSFIPLKPNGGMTIKFGALVKRDERRKTVLAFLQECKRVAETRVPQLLKDYEAERMSSVPPVKSAI